MAWYLDVRAEIQLACSRRQARARCETGGAVARSASRRYGRFINVSAECKHKSDHVDFVSTCSEKEVQNSNGIPEYTRRCNIRTRQIPGEKRKHKIFGRDLPRSEVSQKNAQERWSAQICPLRRMWARYVSTGVMYRCQTIISRPTENCVQHSIRSEDEKHVAKTT